MSQDFVVAKLAKSFGMVAMPKVLAAFMAPLAESLGDFRYTLIAATTLADFADNSAKRFSLGVGECYTKT